MLGDSNKTNKKTPLKWPLGHFFGEPQAPNLLAVQRMGVVGGALPILLLLLSMYI